MLVALVRHFCMLTATLFYRGIIVSGTEVPNDGPILVVANHPNGLLDPMIVRLALKRRVAFLAKSSLFENPIGKITMQAFDALPVFRPGDGSDSSKNESVFRKALEWFSQNGWLLIFPEGTSHSDPTMRRLKTGAARLAFDALEEGLPLQVLPVGITYEAKDVFRSRVWVEVGTPLDLRSLLMEGQERISVRDATGRIEGAMNRVVLQAENEELRRGFLAVARWLMPDEDQQAVDRRARELARAYAALREEDPGAAEEMVERARQYARAVESVGVVDPWQLEKVERPDFWQMCKVAARTAGLTPVALVGTLISWPTYRGIGPLARRIAGKDFDLVSTIKAMAGMLFFPLTWLLQAVVLGILVNWIAASFFLVLAPIVSFLTLRFYERLGMRRQVLRASFLRFRRKDVVDAVVAQRRQLAADIQARLPSKTQA